MKSLFEFADASHQKFFSGLVPGLPVLGVKKAGLSAWIDSMTREEREHFLESLPHHWVEENQVHMLLLNEEKDFQKAADLLNAFIPFVDNWAVSDLLNIKAFKKDQATLDYALSLLQNPLPFSPRLGMLILKRHFLETAPHYQEVLQADRSCKPVSMMCAWYLAEAAVQDSETVLQLLDELDGPTLKRTIQKVIDSRRISAETKDRFRRKRNFQQKKET